jgi:hypothetical protein
MKKIKQFTNSWRQFINENKKEKKPEKKPLTEENLIDILEEEGGAAGMGAFKEAIDASEKEIKAMLEDMEDVGQHEKGDSIFRKKKEAQEKTQKETKEIEKEEGGSMHSDS